MPLYEYRCLDCGNQLEVLQKLSDRPLKRCPKCSGKMEKLISRTSFQLKGGGWFAQGYGGNGNSAKKKDAAKADKKEGGGSAKSGGKEGSAVGASGSSAAPA